jgi:wobble nucleotide-excising tRNase
MLKNWNIFKAKNEAIERLEIDVINFKQQMYLIEQGSKTEIKALKIEVWRLQSQVNALENCINVIQKTLDNAIKHNS